MITPYIMEKQFLSNILTELNFEAQIASEIVKEYFNFNTPIIRLMAIMPTSPYISEDVMKFCIMLQEVVDCVIADKVIRPIPVNRIVKRLRSANLNWHGLDLTAEDLMGL